MNATPYEPLGIGAGSLLAGRYELIKRLGSGAMSVVFQAADKSLNNQIIALKLFAPKIADDPTLLERFRNEVLVTRKLTHSNIVRTYEFGEWNSHFFMTMEYVEGTTLSGLLQSLGHLSVAEASRILYEVLQGISYAHDQGVIHRDLKPANILITTDGMAKITDFGLAQTHEVNKRLTQVGECVGTPYYMCPEQIQERNTDLRGDLYALGIIAFELVTGQVPFQAKGWFELAKQIIEEPLPDSMLKRQRTAQWYVDMIQKCVSKSPGDRFQTAAQMIDALEVNIAFQTTAKLSTKVTAADSRVAATRVAATRINRDVRTDELRGLSLDIMLYKAAPAILVLFVVGFMLIGVAGNGAPAAHRMSEEVNRSTAAIDQFADTLQKLQQVVITTVENKDKIDAFIAAQQKSVADPASATELKQTDPEAVAENAPNLTAVESRPAAVKVLPPKRREVSRPERPFRRAAKNNPKP